MFATMIARTCEFIFDNAFLLCMFYTGVFYMFFEIIIVLFNLEDVVNEFREAAKVDMKEFLKLFVE